MSLSNWEIWCLLSLFPVSKVELDESQPIPPPHPHPMTSQHLHHQPETAPTPPGPTPPGPPPYTQTDDITSSESHDQSRNSEEEVIQQSGVDPEMARLENQLDVWCLDLKRNILVCQPLHSQYMYMVSFRNLFKGASAECIKLSGVEMEDGAS